MWNNPGQVITRTILAPTVAEALTNSLMPLNILSGFKKCGIHPPGEGKDRQLAPSRAVHFKQPKWTPRHPQTQVSLSRHPQMQISLSRNHRYELI